MLTLVNLVAYGSVLAALLVLYFALRLASYLRGGAAWRFLWWIVAAAVLFAAHSVLHVLPGGEENPSEVLDVGTHLVALVFLAFGLWGARAFWKSKSLG